MTCLFLLRLAKILSPPKMARFSLRHSGKSLNSTKNCVEEGESCLGRERAHATCILRIGQMIVRIRQPGRNDAACDGDLSCGS